MITAVLPGIELPKRPLAGRNDQVDFVEFALPDLRPGILPLLHRLFKLSLLDGEDLQHLAFGEADRVIWDVIRHCSYGWASTDTTTGLLKFVGCISPQENEIFLI